MEQYWKNEAYKIVEEIKDEKNTRKAILLIGTLDFDVITLDENPYEQVYDGLVEMGERELAEKYFKKYL